jgi:very-short-patch-repair endonuclease
MKSKYGIQSTCRHCGEAFITRPRFVDYCSTPCKNPINRPGHIPWNTGLKMTEEFKATKMNTEGLAKGRGWNKGIPNPEQSIKWKENNPNKGGKQNVQRFKDGGFWKSYSKGELSLLTKLREEVGEVIHQFTIPRYHRVYDMYIPSLNLIVEYDGDYWHREEKYLYKDSKDTAKAIKNGFKVFRYWESTVKENGVDNIVEDIVKLEGKYCRILKEI